MLVADFPLPHRRETGVEHRREHRLAEVVAMAQGADVRAGIRRHRRQAQRVVLPQPAPIDQASRVEVGRGLVDRRQEGLVASVRRVMANLR